MFAFDKYYAIIEGQVVDVLSFNGYIALKTFSLYPVFGLIDYPKYLGTK